MEHSLDIAELMKALSKCQGAMGKAIKSSVNPFHKSKYANLESVWDACRDHLSNNGLAVIQSPAFEDGRVKITTMLAHASGQWLRSHLSIKPQTDTPHAVGSAITYGKRYSLMAIVGVADDNDDDGNAATEKKKKVNPQTLQEIEQDDDGNAATTREKNVDHKTLVKIEKLLEGVDIETFSGWIEKTFHVKFENLHKLKQNNAETIIAALNKRKVKNDQ